MTAITKLSIKRHRIWQKALENFPYELMWTFHQQGLMSPDDDGEIHFSKEFTFNIGTIFDNQDLVAGGWIEFQADNENLDGIYISGHFAIAINGGFHNPKQQLLCEHRYLMAYYDIDSQEWHLEVDTM